MIEIMKLSMIIWLKMQLANQTIQMMVMITLIGWR